MSNTGLMQFVLKSQQDIFGDIEKIILIFIWKDKRTRIDKKALKKKNEVGGIILYNFKTYYRTKVIQSILAEG